MSGPITVGEAIALSENACKGPPPTGQLFFESLTGTSNTFEVGEYPLILRLMQLATPLDEATICVDMVWGCHEGDFFSPLTMNYAPVCLSPTCRVVVIPLTGRYRLRYTGALSAGILEDLLVTYEKTTPHAVSWFTSQYAPPVEVEFPDTTAPPTAQHSAVPTRYIGSGGPLGVYLGAPSGWYNIGGRRVPYWV